MSDKSILDSLRLNADQTRRLIVDFMREEIGKAGFSRAVMGLSGGVDSALVCFLLAEALGPENVLALRLPYRASSPDSLEHAQMVIDHLGVEADTIDITPMAEPLITRFPDMTPLRKGNILARVRMIVLYDQSAAFGGLVIGSANKTETLLGYATQHGDSAAAMHPLADLYKAQVRQLARAVGVPEVIIQKPPSADLWPGQTDEGELGFTYEDADQLLYLLVDQGRSPDEAAEAGFDRALVEKVWSQMQRTAYKRRLPLVPRLPTY